MTKKSDKHWSVSVRAGVVEVQRDGEVIGHGHWDGKRVVHPDYQVDAGDQEQVDQLVKDTLPGDAWESADGAADELVGTMSDGDKDEVSRSGSAEAWRGTVSENHRADGLDHEAVLRAMYELIKRARPILED